jgi:hypothetical protein
MCLRHPSISYHLYFINCNKLASEISWRHWHINVTLAYDEIITILTLEINHMDEFFLSVFLFCFCFGISFHDLYTSQQKKRYKHFFKYIFMLKPKQLFIIIYVNVCVKCVYPHETNNNILFRIGKIPESKFSIPWSSLRWSNYTLKSPAVINCAINKGKQFAILKIRIFTRTSMPRLRQNASGWNDSPGRCKPLFV